MLISVKTLFLVVIVIIIIIIRLIIIIRNEIIIIFVGNFTYAFLSVGNVLLLTNFLYYLWIFVLGNFKFSCR